MYYVAVLIEEGEWQETFGSRDKLDVDCEVIGWRENGAKKVDIYRARFSRTPTQAQVEAFVQSKKG